jgi:D-alanine-D-alanine ligase-like ATP-grasp enzyme
MQMIDTILFVYSEQPVIDRGWDPGYAKIELSRLGFHIQDLFVNEKAEISGFFAGGSQNMLVWPVCYTIGREVDGPLLVEMLDQLRVPFMGASAETLRLNSKIQLKQRLKGSQFQTPDYKIVDSDNVETIDFPLPYIMKYEYSCDSKGVCVVRDVLEGRQVFDSLKGRFGQRVFAERWERKREFTVAYIPNDIKPTIAPLEMIITSHNLIVDSDVKVHNDYLRFEVPGKDLRDRLISYISDFGDLLSVDGYFRVDILLNERNTLHIIDMNLLPYMNASRESLSYFPMCFQLNYGFSFQQAICAMLEAARKKGGSRFASIVEDRMRRIGFPESWQQRH